MLDILLDVLTDSVLDCLKMLPILYLSYLLMEWLEHRAGGRLTDTVAKVGKAGPFIGSALGVIPQCGFSGAVASLYAGGVATAGTLIAVLLSTSDEMLPILLSSGTGAALIGKLVLVKFLSGVLFGFLVDLLLRRGPQSEIRELCEREHCSCGKHNIFVSALIHCGQVLAVIFAVTFLLGLAFSFLGDSLRFPAIPVVGELLTGLLGLVPSCSVSVLLTGLYTKGVLSAGALLSGLCTNGGVGLLVLFRLNKDSRDNLRLVGILYLCGVLTGLSAGLLF